MIDRYPLSAEEAKAFSVEQSDIAAGIPVYVSGVQNVQKIDPIPIADQQVTVRERLEPTIDKLRSNTASQGEQ